MKLLPLAMVKKRHRGKSTAWLQRWQQDPWVQQSQQSHYRSRAVYKLREIDRTQFLFRQARVVIDLGAAPGSWSQYVSEKVKKPLCLLAVDQLPVQAIQKVHFIQGDFNSSQIQDDCIRLLGDYRADLVLSDIAPNITGIRDTDQARSMELASQVLIFCHRALQPGGKLLVKVFTGVGVEGYTAHLRKYFARVSTHKPDASRSQSREYYLLACGYEPFADEQTAHSV